MNQEIINFGSSEDGAILLELSIICGLFLILFLALFEGLVFLSVSREVQLLTNDIARITAYRDDFRWCNSTEHSCSSDDSRECFGKRQLLRELQDSGRESDWLVSVQVYEEQQEVVDSDDGLEVRQYVTIKAEPMKFACVACSMVANLKTFSTYSTYALQGKPCEMRG